MFVYCFSMLFSFFDDSISIVLARMTIDSETWSVETMGKHSRNTKNCQTWCNKISTSPFKDVLFQHFIPMVQNLWGFLTFRCNGMLATHQAISRRRVNDFKVKLVEQREAALKVRRVD